MNRQDELKQEIKNLKAQLVDKLIASGTSKTRAKMMVTFGEATSPELDAAWAEFESIREPGNREAAAQLSDADVRANARASSDSDAKREEINQ